MASKAWFCCLYWSSFIFLKIWWRAVSSAFSDTTYDLCNDAIYCFYIAHNTHNVSQACNVRAMLDISDESSSFFFRSEDSPLCTKMILQGWQMIGSPFQKMWGQIQMLGKLQEMYTHLTKVISPGLQRCMAILSGLQRQISGTRLTMSKFRFSISSYAHPNSQITEMIGICNYHQDSQALPFCLTRLCIACIVTSLKKSDYWLDQYQAMLYMWW